MTAYHSKPLAMTLRKLTLSVSLLAALLTLAAPVKAETWACVYIDNGKPASTNFVREGKIFRDAAFRIPYRILKEDDRFIQLWFEGNKIADPYFTVLFKKERRFTHIRPLPNGNVEMNGSCKVY